MLRIDTFELLCWRRLLKIPWRARRSNLSILKEFNIHWKDWCWSWSSSPLATWCKEVTHWKRPWFWERLRAAEKVVTKDEMVGWHHNSMDMSLSKRWEIVKDRKAWTAADHVIAKSGTQLRDWATTTDNKLFCKAAWFWHQLLGQVNSSKQWSIVFNQFKWN